MLKRSKIKQMSEINVVPYIDVMLVLLVIFMVTTPLLSQGVKVDLPQAQAKPFSSDTPEPIIVSIDAYGNYYLNIAANPNQPLSQQELTVQVSQQLYAPIKPPLPQIQQIQQQAQQQQVRQTLPTTQQAQLQPRSQLRQVLVKGDKNVNYGKVVQAMVVLKNAGAASVGLMTQFDEGEGVGIKGDDKKLVR